MTDRTTQSPPPPPPGAGPGADMLSLTVDELAARAGTTVRTLRFYATKGLLPPPVLGPRRVGRYGPEHLARLALVEELQHQGLTLSAIERYLDQLPDDITPEDLAMHRALVSAWMPDSAEETPRSQLERRAGRMLADHDIDRLAAMGVMDRTGDPDVFVVNPAMLHLGVRLLDVPIPLETILATREILLKHTRAVAHDLQKLFRAQVWEPYVDAERDPDQVARMRSLTEYIQPAVVQALVTAFQRSLQEELRTSPSRGPARPVTGP